MAPLTVLSPSLILRHKRPFNFLRRCCPRRPDRLGSGSDQTKAMPVAAGGRWKAKSPLFANKKGRLAGAAFALTCTSSSSEIC